MGLFTFIIKLEKILLIVILLVFVAIKLHLEHLNLVVDVCLFFEELLVLIVVLNILDVHFLAPVFQCLVEVDLVILPVVKVARYDLLSNI